MANYNPLPAVGEIVWCHFPESENLGNPGPKPRPGVILNVFPDIHAVLIAYGTSQKCNSVYAGEFVIDEQLETAGLDRPAKFDLRRLQKLPFNEQWFGVAPGLSKKTPLPKLGVIPPLYISPMRAAWQELKAYKAR